MFRLQLIATSFLLIAGLTAVQAEASGRYLLGAQDRITIRVYDLRRNTGEAYAWSALNGEFGVGADGSVSLPLIGRVQASGGTTNDLADAIGRLLKQTADLTETPAASVEVTKYRPFYVTGAVKQPGKYEYQPNLSVLQAVSTAEGLVRAADLRLIQREVVTASGDLRSLAAEHIALETKLTRLDAEVEARDSIVFSEGLRAQATDPRIEQAMRGERQIFETRRNSLRAELAALEQLKANYRQELVALDAKGKSLDRQIDLIRRELDLVNDLVAKGLTITPRKLAAEQSQASYESNRLDVQVATLRAQQSLSQADRDGIELQSRFRREALSEIAETRLRLNQNEERAHTAERLVADAEAQMLGSDGISELLVPSYEISRMTSSGMTTWGAQEEDLVEPGDVVQVIIVRQRTKSSSNRGEAASTAPQRVSESNPVDTPSPNATPPMSGSRKTPAGEAPGLKP